MKIHRDSWHWRVYEAYSMRRYKKTYDERVEIVDRAKRTAEKDYDTDSHYGRIEKRDAVESYHDAVDHWGSCRLNLCPYMRTIMFYAPVRWFFQGYAKNPGENPLELLKVPVLWVVINAAIILFGWITATYPLVVGTFMVVITLGILLMGGIILGLAWLIDTAKARKAAAVERNALARFNEAPKPVVVPPMEKEFGLFRSWIHAKHQKVCPILEVDTKNQKGASG